MFSFLFLEPFLIKKIGDAGKEKNFFSREKKFFPSPTPPSFFKKSEVWLLQFVAARPLEMTDDHFVIIDYLPILGTELLIFIKNRTVLV